MIAFDLAYELTLGAACAACAALAPSSRGGALAGPSSPDRAEARCDGLFVSGLVYIPLCAAGLAAFPGWQSMYLVDIEGSRCRAAWFSGLMIAALFGSFGLGFELAVAWLRRGLRLRALLVGLGAGWAALLVVLFGLMPARALWITSYERFHGGAPPELGWGEPGALLGGPGMYFLFGSAAVNMASLAWLFGRARQRARAAGGSGS
jgi:hypothetical protein